MYADADGNITKAILEGIPTDSSLKWFCISLYSFPSNVDS